MARPIQASIRTHADEPSGGEREAAEFREAMAFWATGVAVLAASDGDEVEAITVAAFTPLSADPPLVLACVGNDAAVLYVHGGGGALHRQPARGGRPARGQRIRAADAAGAAASRRARTRCCEGALVRWSAGCGRRTPAATTASSWARWSGSSMGEARPSPCSTTAREYRTLG